MIVLRASVHIYATYRQPGFRVAARTMWVFPFLLNVLALFLTYFQDRFWTALVYDFGRFGTDISWIFMVLQVDFSINFHVFR